MTMASMTQTTPTDLRRRLPWQRVALLLLLLIGLAVAGIALVAAPRPSAVATVRVPAPVASAALTSRTIAAYDDLLLQWQAAEQALRAGDTEAYEIAVSGADALRSRIADLRAQQHAMTEVDRAIIDAYEQLHSQRLAAEQALRARNTEAYEIAVSGAEALQSRIVDLRAQSPPD
jgi:hypothetical protein